MNTKGWVQDAAELAFRELQDELHHHQVNVSVGFLDQFSAINIELRRTRLNWRYWFKEEHFRLENRFALAIHSGGRPPIIIAAAVYSYERNTHQVSIHMLEHFKNAVLNSGLEKRMTFCVFFAAYSFGQIIGAETFKICNPLGEITPYYQYWDFIYNEHGDLVITKAALLNRLRMMSLRGGEHDYESPDPEFI